jgi:hypothetical protein
MRLSSGVHCQGTDRTYDGVTIYCHSVITLSFQRHFGWRLLAQLYIDIN